MGSLRVLIALALGAALAIPSAAAAEEPTPVETRLEELINRARVQRGVPPLARSTELDAAAETHSQDMVQQRFLDHEGSDGSTPRERAARHGYVVPESSGWIVVEVISAISADPSGPLGWWLDESPEIHGKALLNPRWREIGVGYASGGEYGNYWTVLLGCRPGVLPTVVLDGVMHRHEERCGDAEGAAASRGPEIAGAGVATPRLAIVTARSAVRRVPGWSTLEVAWSGVAEPAATDWIGLFEPGAPERDYLAWAYVSCARLPTNPRARGSCAVPRPLELQAGTYEVRLFARDGYERLATSPPIPAEALRPEYLPPDGGASLR